MGASASRGWDNDSLIDKLLDGGLSLPPDLERAMRLVDRGDYFEEKSQRAYMDLAWRSGSLHLSAPSIYISALNSLDLAPGQHFLNIGSGSGYLSTVIGLILGHNGINHGIELNEDNVNFSKQRLATFLTSSDAPCERDFCIPNFVRGNIFNLVVPPSSRNDSNNRTDAPQGSEDDSDSDGPDDEGFPLFMNEEVEAVHNTVNNLNEPSSEDTQAREDQAPEGHVGRQARRSRIAVLKIDPPPIVEVNGTNTTSTNGVKQWPTYDRIYVGGGIRSRVQLQALLRLLKIGGVMVAPVQDELLKITRLSEDQISRTELLSVSFASLVVPSANSNSHPIEPPPPEEVPSLLRLCARCIRHLLRTQIELRQNGRPTLGRLIEVESHGAKQKKKKTKKEHSQGRPSTEGEQSPSASRSTEGTDASESDHSEPGGDSRVLNGDTILESPDGHSSRDDDQASPQSNRSESPDVQRDSGSMVRFLHHLLLRSRMGRSGGPTSPRPNETPTFEERTERDRIPEADESGDRSQVLVLNLSREQDQPSPENTTEPSEPRMRFHLRVAERLLAVIDGAEEVSEEQNEQENPRGDSQEEGTSTRAVAGSENNDDHSTTDHQSRQRQEKRRRGVKYQPPSYRYRDEMRRILSEELHLPELFVRQVFVM